MNETIYENMKKVFAEELYHYEAHLEEVRSRCVRSVITKGLLANVLPYEEELISAKVNGKIISAPIIKDDCYRYSYDEQGRIILSEEMCTLKKDFRNCKMYFYEGNRIAVMYWTGERLATLTLCHLADGIVQDRYVVGHYAHSYYTYHYENGRLMRLDEQYLNEEGSGCEYVFYYQENGKLLKIIRMCPNGYSDVRYSAQKINYKKLEERLCAELRNAFAEFAQTHPEEYLTAMAFVCWSGHGSLVISANADNSDYSDTPADWKYNEIANIALLDVPLDDKECGKVLVSTAKAVNAATMEQEFAQIHKADGFYATIFHHDLPNAERKMTKIKKIVMDNPWFVN